MWCYICASSINCQALCLVLDALTWLSPNFCDLDAYIPVAEDTRPKCGWFSNPTSPNPLGCFADFVFFLISTQIPVDDVHISFIYPSTWATGFPSDSVVKNLPANAGDAGSIPWVRKTPWEGNGNPFQYSCLGNPMDREAWKAIVHGVTKSQIRLSD